MACQDQLPEGNGVGQRGPSLGSDVELRMHQGREALQVRNFIHGEDLAANSLQRLS